MVTWRELGREHEEEGEARVGREGVPGWSSAELTLAGLRSFARYALSVRAYNRAGAGPHSPTVYATTADGGTYPARPCRARCTRGYMRVCVAVPEEAPGGVSCETLSARSLRVRWAPLSTAHAHALRGYDLHYAPLHFASSKIYMTC